MTRLCVFSEGMLQRMATRIEPWKDRYKGERCFCVGNGPSLRETPLHLLKNEYSFGLNRIAKIYLTTTWRPSFYVNVTVAVLDDGWAADAREAMIDTPSFVGFAAMPHILSPESDSNRIAVPRNVFPVSVSKGGRDMGAFRDSWSHNIADRVSKTGSSMLAVMQIAVYLGFNPLIMVGCDARWEPFDYEEDIDPNHFVEDYWGKMNLDGKKIEVTPERAKGYTDDAMWCHRLAKKECDKLGVNVYNATVGGDLEIYPRVDFMDVIK